FGDVIR
ncbi:hypothetical protein D039_0396B, partial [Vibrio parahaemolyticus EKP-028]